MMMIQRRTVFYLGQDMKMTGPNGEEIIAVYTNGDAVVPHAENHGVPPCECNKLDSERQHSHCPGLFTSEQVRDHAILALCELAGWDPPGSAKAV